MTAAGDVRTAEAALTLARDGDEAAFAALTGPYQAELRAHCYRMLGSVHDADDAVQETLLKAWRGLSRFEGRSSVRSWLYAIATNAAVDLARHRSRRELPVDFGAPSAAGSLLEPPPPGHAWLEPFPDSWAGDGALSPEARYEQRESVELAFLVALQCLSPLQRAVLLLREVAGFSTAEISRQLGTSPAAVNSALHRARATTESRMPAASQQSAVRLLGDEQTRALVQRYAAAIEQADVGALVSMLTEDATWSMPPVPCWFSGHEGIRDFLVRYPLSLRWQHRPARANGQLAVGCYLFAEETGDYRPAVLDVLTVRGPKIAAVTGFQVRELPPPPHSADLQPGADVFARFGLPPSVPG
jgi:RNA polymerase sigma-70 factor (ECF subfamily)